jgi:hypothetical protein
VARRFQGPYLFDQIVDVPTGGIMRKPILWLAIGLLLLSLSLTAQTTLSSTVTGTVTDPSGAVVPNATVEIRDPTNNATRSATTGETGQYIFTNVAPGSYQISAKAQGFKTATDGDGHGTR